MKRRWQDPGMTIPRRAYRKLRRSLGFRDVVFVPQDPLSVPADAASVPHLRFATAEKVAADAVRGYVRAHGKQGRFLDVGGGAGLYHQYAGPLEFFVLDLGPPEGERMIRADICSCPEVPSGSFDIAFSHNTFEHIAEPWLAAGEMGRLLKPGGLAIVVTCFSWRYHPVPGDYFRFSHAALELIFERHGGLETVSSGYDLRQRREDRRGGKLANGLDRLPIDELGGWRENWLVYYVGRKSA
jgi:SAM-dependent methyltransferase